MIDLIIKTNGSERHLSLPIDEQFVPGIAEKNSVTTVMVVNEPESLRYLYGKQWNVDELNFLAKRLESFDNLEERQFSAAVEYNKPETVAELINITFNLPRYSVIKNVSDLAEVGRTYVITRQQAMSLEEIEQTDFAKIGRELLSSGKGIPTEYGLLFINEDIPEEQVYDGKHFPDYSYKDTLLCVSVTCKGETEYWRNHHSTICDAKRKIYLEKHNSTDRKVLPKNGNIFLFVFFVFICFNKKYYRVMTGYQLTYSSIYDIIYSMSGLCSY